MYETTMNDHSTLMIPLQAAPVDRTPPGAAAFMSEAGVEASDWMDIAEKVGGGLWNIGKSLGW